MTEGLCRWELLSSRVGGSEFNIDAPADVVELNKHISDLTILIDLEQIESLNGNLSRANDHLPVPQNVAAAGGHDLDGLDVIDRWSEKDTVDVVLLAGESDATDLFQS